MKGILPLLFHERVIVSAMEWTHVHFASFEQPLSWFPLQTPRSRLTLRCCRCRGTFVGIFHRKCQVFFWDNSLVQFLASTPTPPRQEHKDYGCRAANRRQLPQFRSAGISPHRSHHSSIDYWTRSWTWFVDFGFASIQISSQLHILQDNFGIGNHRIVPTDGSNRMKMKFQAFCRKDRVIGRHLDFRIHKAFDIKMRPSKLLIWHGRTIYFPSIRLISSPILRWSIENQSDDSRVVLVTR